MGTEYWMWNMWTGDPLLLSDRNSPDDLQTSVELEKKKRSGTATNKCQTNVVLFCGFVGRPTLHYDLSQRTSAAHGVGSIAGILPRVVGGETVQDEAVGAGPVWRDDVTGVVLQGETVYSNRRFHNRSYYGVITDCTELSSSFSGLTSLLDVGAERLELIHFCPLCPPNIFPFLMSTTLGSGEFCHPQTLRSNLI